MSGTILYICVHYIFGGLRWGSSEVKSYSKLDWRFPKTSAQHLGQLPLLGSGSCIQGLVRPTIFAFSRKGKGGTTVPSPLCPSSRSLIIWGPSMPFYRSNLPLASGDKCHSSIKWCAQTSCDPNPHQISTTFLGFNISLVLGIWNHPVTSKIFWKLIIYNVL